MRKSIWYFNTTLYGLVLLLFSMCNVGELDFDDIKLPNYRPSVPIVIGETTYTVKELIEEIDDASIDISTDNANLLAVTYRDTIRFDDYLSVIELDNISNPGIIKPNSTPIPGSPIDQDVTIPTQDLSFTYKSPNNEELDSVKYSKGTLVMDIRSDYDSDVDYDLTLTDIINLDTGKPMVLSGTLSGNGEDQVTRSLVNHKTAIVRGAGPGNVNLFSGKFDGIIKVKTGDAINGTEEINYTIDIKDADFSEIYGWFGDKTISLQDKTINADFFKGFSESGIVFGTPQINFYTDNSFGVPMGLNLGGISSTNESGTSVTLSGKITESPQLVRSPSISELGKSLSSSIEINETNSNLRDLLATSPTSFQVKVSAEANFENKNDQNRNFVTSNSQVEAITEIHLPLNVQLKNFSRNFRTNIEGFDFKDADTINLVLKTENQLPFDGIVDMQFLAADSSVLFQYKDILLLTSPEVPTLGKVQEAAINKAKIPVYMGNGYQELLDATTLNLVMRVNSYKADEDNFVKIFSDYKLTLKVSAQVKVNYEL